jgi:TrmH family RNA methyltransferase
MMKLLMASADVHSLRRITSRQNALLKQVRQAFSRAERTPDGLVAIEGFKTVDEAIRSGLKVHAAIISDSGRDRASHLLPQLPGKAETVIVDDEIFKSLSATTTPQGVAALVEMPAAKLDTLTSAEAPLIVICMGLQDPGNLGTIVRSAEGFGAHGMVLAEGTVSMFNPKTIRAAAGSAFRLPIVEAKFAEAVRTLREKGVRLMGTSSHEGQALPEAELTGGIAIVIGNEGAGLPKAVRATLDSVLTIPHSSRVESLNAAMAASLILYEAARQRRTYL